MKFLKRLKNRVYTYIAIIFLIWVYYYIKYRDYEFWAGKPAVITAILLAIFAGVEVFFNVEKH